MNGPIKGSLRQRVLAAVMGGASTAAEVLRVVGRFITAPQAMLHHRIACKANENRTSKWSRKGTGKKLGRERQGRKHLVTQYLARLAKAGKIARLSRGKYGPPQKKGEQDAPS